MEIFNMKNHTIYSVIAGLALAIATDSCAYMLALYFALMALHEPKK